MAQSDAILVLVEKLLQANDRINQLENEISKRQSENQAEKNVHNR